MSGLETSTESPYAAAALAGGVKPRRWGSWYVAEHRIYSMRAYIGTIVATSFGNPLVYLFALGVGLASLVKVPIPVGDGTSVSYLAFVAPALLASAAVTAASEETTYPFMMGFKWNPIFYAMNAAPISGNQVTNGMYISVLARVIPTCIIYFVVMVLFGAVPSSIGFLGILSASATGIAIGCLITPMMLFSGTFFPLTQLPIFLQWIGWISPLWHGAQLGRVLGYGLVEPAWLTGVHVVYLLALTAVCWIVTQRFVTRRLSK
jgi:lipooligosaccharide transport system permease protein